MIWEGLSPPYGTIVADPPWRYDEGWPKFGDRKGVPHDRTPLPYSGMDLDDIRSLPVVDLAADNGCLFLWTTNRYLCPAFDVMAAWGFSYSATLVWAKTPQGVGPGGSFSITTEFVLYGRRGSPGVPERHPTTWWNWAKGPHSAKPDAFMDIVEQVSPGPYVELFCRRPRFGWDSWGKGYEIGAA